VGTEIYEKLKNELVLRLPTLKVLYFDSQILFYPGEQLYDAQRGYRYDDQRQSLLSQAEGGWQSSWYVIGRVSGRNRPLFVDVEKSEWPIYVAEIGLEGWQPICIAARSADLLVIVRWIGQTYYEMGEEEKQELIQSIVQLGGEQVNRQFWQEWIMPKGKQEEDYF
jgi:hypothetical protein